MHIPLRPLDPTLKTLFDPDSPPPPQDEWFEQTQRDEEAESQLVTAREQELQRELRLRHDVAKRRRKTEVGCV
jgi:hypothetical protein